MKKIIAALALLAIAAPASAQPYGPSLQVQQSGTTKVSNAHVLNFTNCTVTGSGATASLSCAGTVTAASSPIVLSGGTLSCPTCLVDGTNALTTAVLFNNSVAGLGGSLFTIQNSAATLKYFDVGDTNSQLIRYVGAAAATTKGFVVDSGTDLSSTTGAEIQSWQNSGTEEAGIDPAGTFVCGKSCAGQAGNGTIPANATFQARMVGGNGGIGYCTIDTARGVQCGWTTHTFLQLDGTNVELFAQTTNSQILLEGGVAVEAVTVADANYSAVTTDYIIGYSSISASRTVTLLNNATQAALPRFYVVKDQSGSASNVNTIVVKASVGNVDGAASRTCVSSAYGACRVYCDGTNCFTW